jgi:hypothetical protein
VQLKDGGQSLDALKSIVDDEIAEIKVRFEIPI